MTRRPRAPASVARAAPPAVEGGPIPGWAWLALLGILAAAAWIHRGALAAPFFADDYLFLERVMGRSLAQALAAPDPLGNYFRPVSRQLYFWALAALGHGEPLLFHLKALGLFLLSIVLLFAIAARALGARAGLVAAAFLALHHSADVAVLWASGAQDLLATVSALAALWCFQRGRSALAAVALALGLLSKETVLFTPVIALLVARRPRETLKSAAMRAWPMGATLAIWAVLYAATLGQRAGLAHEARFDPAGALAVPVQLLRTALGLEQPGGGQPARAMMPDALALGVVLAILGAVAWTGRRGRPQPAGSRAAAPDRGAWIGGAGWALLAALPVAAVAHIWSAYYYLFAIAGVGFLLAALLRPLPAWVAPVVVAALGWGAARSRALPDFATVPDAWSPRSHVNRAYLERGMERTSHYLSELRRVRPTVPAHSTLYFSGLPGNIGFQTGDGPVLRWAYRDSTLLGRFVSAFRVADAARGPCLFFEVHHDLLTQVTGPDSLRRLGLAMMMSDKPEAARDLLTLHVAAHPADTPGWYALALERLALGDRAGGVAALERAHLQALPGPTPEVAVAYAAVSAGDTARAIELVGRGVTAHALDPGVHALFADILLARDRESVAGATEAFAARALAPADPGAWRRWAMVQAVLQRLPQALVSLREFQRLAGPGALEDGEMRALEQRLVAATGGAAARASSPSGPD